jgi:hypothetical protein
MLILKKKRRVLLEFATVKYSIGPQKRIAGLKKTKQGRLRGRQVLGGLFLSRLRFEISRLRLRFLAGLDLPM